ncbi:hypothetical protein EMPS_07492 [Entomortierella parvispora]|uniref:Cas12f1-like TNB domain-containing protein n=1 Tax=Entomortierella parvispora TaxID=205924 RepID=A0A9P3HEE2_9FUNG|nr:hypothetical protein EMPS_07492 [Entomortierella parvispora]
MDHLDLPTEQHLLLACIVTTNDYVKNIPYFGLLTNCDIVRGMDLSALGPLGEMANNAERAEAIMPFVQRYIDEVNRRLVQRKLESKRQTKALAIQQGGIDVEVCHYHHSVTAFVARTATSMAEPLLQEDQSPRSHYVITAFLQEMYARKAQQEHSRRFKASTNALIQHPSTDTVSTTELSATVADLDIESVLSSTSTQVGPKKVCASSRKRKSSQKRLQNRKDRFKDRLAEKKRKKWEDSQFRPRTHDQRQYVVRSVNILDAPGVEESELLKMTIPAPRIRKATGDSKKVDSNNNGNSATTSSNGQKSNAKKKRKKPRKPKKAKSGPASLKTGFSTSFATSTQTLGSVQGCLRRALLPAGESGRIQRLSNNDINAIANRIEAAVSTIAEARMYVCRLLVILVYDALLKQQTPEAAPELHGEAFDVLDLLLEKSTGTAIIRYFFALVLNGKIDARGKKIVKEKTLAAKRMAEATYTRLKDMLPGLTSVNRRQIPLSRVIVHASMEMGVQLRKHFKEIPFTIGGRMKKCGWKEEDIPQGATESDNNDDEEDDEDDGEDEVEVDDGDEEGNDDDAESCFNKGHIQRWWREARRLPLPMMPVFSLRHQFKDPFVTFEERALPAILWSTSKSRPNPAAAAASKILSAKEATKLTEEHYGELTRTLFYGDPDEIRKSKRVWQTPYGRRSTTMHALAKSCGDVFSSTALHTFLDLKFTHVAKTIECLEKGIPCDSAPPPLPTTRLPQELRPFCPRYAISNIFSTNGTELNINCYDTTKPHRKQSTFVPIYRIESKFPTTKSILDEFGVSSIDEIEAWGVDPGEVNTAAFCRVVREESTTSDTASSTTVFRPGVEAKNLTINRKALYQPVFAHREQMNALISKRILISQGQPIQGALWAKDDKTLRDDSVCLPSISDVQDRLPSRQHTSTDDIEHSTKTFFQSQGLLHGFYSAKRIKRMAWSLKKVKKAEIDRAIDSILKQCTKKTLFCYGNGSFRTGINLASPHETFKAIFAQKATAAGHIVVLIDEYLTSSLCPSCLEMGVSSRLAKPTMRSCVCLVCARWLHRDVIGAQNIAVAGEAWLHTQARPLPLCRPISSTNLPKTNICAENAVTFISSSQIDS